MPSAHPEKYKSNQKEIMVKIAQIKEKTLVKEIVEN